MKNVKKLLFALLLIAAAILSTPRTTLAVSWWCNICAQTGDCYPCCKCSGDTTAFCTQLCS